MAQENPELVNEMLEKLRNYRMLRPEGGVPPMVEPLPEGWKPPKNWELISPGDQAGDNDY
jgi:hypothetical protein